VITTGERGVVRFERGVRGWFGSKAKVKMKSSDYLLVAA
jgi:hypothetical protein